MLAGVGKKWRIRIKCRRGSLTLAKRRRRWSERKKGRTTAAASAASTAIAIASAMNGKKGSSSSGSSISSSLLGGGSVATNDFGYGDSASPPSEVELGEESPAQKRRKLDSPSASTSLPLSTLLSFEEELSHHSHSEDEEL